MRQPLSHLDAQGNPLPLATHMNAWGEPVSIGDETVGYFVVGHPISVESSQSLPHSQIHPNSYDALSMGVPWYVTTSGFATQEHALAFLGEYVKRPDVVACLGGYSDLLIVELRGKAGDVIDAANAKTLYRYFSTTGELKDLNSSK